MNKLLKVVCCIVVFFLVILYSWFLFILPRKVDLNVYKPIVQKFVFENTGLNFNCGKMKFTTSPFLEVGVKTDNLNLMLPDNSNLFSAKSFDGKIFLPSLLLNTIHVSRAELESPKLNIEILNNEKFKVAKTYEDLVNKRRQQKQSQQVLLSEKTIGKLPFKSSKSKFIVSDFKLNNYSAILDDVATGHKLVLKGKDLSLGYYNGKTAKLKTKVKLLSDNKPNIIANIDVDTFIPKFSIFEPQEDDFEAVYKLPFVNPVTEYRNYNLKSNINTKLKIRKDVEDKKVRMYGFLNVEDTTVSMSGLELPKSYLKLRSNGTLENIETKLYVTDKEYINLMGTFDYGKSPYVDLSLKSPKVHLSNLVNVTKAYLDTVHIKNDIKYMAASGYLLANASLKTDFNEILSSGKIIIRNGNIIDRNIQLLVNDINANLFFDDNVFQVVDTHALINNHLLNLSGRIDNNSIANFHIKGDKIPLAPLYKAFAPKEYKNSFDLASGFLTINTKLTGEIKDIAALFEADLENFILREKHGKFIFSNTSSHLGVANSLGKIKGRIKNTGFNLVLPQSGSVLYNDLFTVDIDNRLVKTNKSVFKFNNNSEVVVSGVIKNILSEPEAKLFADGKFVSSDLIKLLDKNSAKYIDKKGVIPAKAMLRSNEDKMVLVIQAQSDKLNYFTPVHLKDLLNKQSILQIMLEKKGDVIKISKSGLYTKNKSTPFGNNFVSNLYGAREVVSLRAMISNLKTTPFINIIKVSIPKSLSGSLCIFKNSKFILSGGLYIFGEVDTPHINGTFNIRDLSIPEISTLFRHIIVNFNNNDINVLFNDVSLYGSDLHIELESNWDLLKKNIISNVSITSRFLEIYKFQSVLMHLSNVLSNPLASGSSVDYEILKGNFKIKNIKTLKTTMSNTSGHLSLLDNVLFLNDLKTNFLGGNISGDISANLKSNEVKAKLNGKSFNVEKLFAEMFNMKDVLSGILNFKINITYRGDKYEECLKSLRGYADFNVKNGKLGPFGKFENFLMAENIRNNSILSSNVGLVLPEIVEIDTSQFNYMFGHLIFSRGFAKLQPVKTQGRVMSMNISGAIDLLDNNADLILNGKISSNFAEKLGILYALNPSKISKFDKENELAKDFTNYSDLISEKELHLIPHIISSNDDEIAIFEVLLRGDTRIPLKMIKSFKWLVSEAEMEKAKAHVEKLTAPEVNNGTDNDATEMVPSKLQNEETNNE